MRPAALVVMAAVTLAAPVAAAVEDPTLDAANRLSVAFEGGPEMDAIYSLPAYGGTLGIGIGFQAGRNTFRWGPQAFGGRTRYGLQVLDVRYRFTWERSMTARVRTGLEAGWFTHFVWAPALADRLFAFTFGYGLAGRITYDVARFEGGALYVGARLGLDYLAIDAKTRETVAPLVLIGGITIGVRL